MVELCACVLRARASCGVALVLWACPLAALLLPSTYHDRVGGSKRMSSRLMLVVQPYC